LHPAVALVAQQRNFPPDFRREIVAPNILILQRTSPGDPLICQPWADAFLADTADPLFLAQVSSLAELPMLVAHPLFRPMPIDEARAACDALQRDLAPVGQFAGYIV